jgi:hypothetical protein
VLVAALSLLVPATPTQAADPKADGHSFQPLQVAQTTTIESLRGPLTHMPDP